MSGHVAEILAKEGLGKVIGVGHDWLVGSRKKKSFFYVKCNSILK